MQRPIIGIVSRTKGWNDSLVFTDRYYVLDNYTQAIVRNGGVPIALVMIDYVMAFYVLVVMKFMIMI